MNQRLGWILFVGSVAGTALLVGGKHHTKLVVAQSAVEGCPETSAPTLQSGATLKGFAAASNGGVKYDDASASLQLKNKGSSFKSDTLTVNGAPQYTCAADFDKDGWVDFVGGTGDGKYLGFYKNLTKDNQDADLVTYAGAIPWSTSTYSTAPKFERRNPPSNWFYTYASTCDGGGIVGCGDFNGDGNSDFVYIVEDGNNGGRPCRADMFLGNGAGSFGAPYQLTDRSNAAALDDFRDIRWDGNVVPVDYNRDGKLDFLFGAEERSGTDRGFVQVFLNDGGAGYTATASKPTFTPGAVLVGNIDIGASGVNGVAYADVTGDGIKDLGVVGKNSSNMFIYPGLSGGGVDTTGFKVVNPLASPSQLLAADFTLDGRKDIIAASEAGVLRLWENNGLSNPFGTPYRDLVEAFSDFDTGLVFDYDNDPDRTPDLLLGDDAGGYATFANRLLAERVGCGSVESGILDLGALSSAEMVVTSGRLEPTIELPVGTTATFFMSNEEPANWQLASACVDDANDYCVSFPRPAGRDVRWKATLCTDASKTQTPLLKGVGVSFDYTEATEHYRAGVVVDDGVAYVGAFRQPGDRGHMYGVSAELGETYWDFADQLDATPDANRKVYTADVNGRTRLDFSVSNANSVTLKAALGASSTAQAQQIITWQRSARFGLSGTSRLGAVQNSTPAIIGAPTLPIWYPRADQATREKVDTFISDHKDRDKYKIALFGSKDGAIHAVRTLPTDIGDPINGTEAWAFIPAKIANDLLADMTSNNIRSFPDGSPTVTDVILADGNVHTVAIIGGGTGHKSVTAIDITETINETTGVVIGPTPLWHLVPGGASAGQALSKPVIARVNVAGTPRFYAIMATGVASDNPSAPFTKGRDVVAVDVATGNIVWQFQSKCAVTSDLVIFETDDELEPDAPVIDGFVDRAVWADSCGYVYKVNPARSVGTGYITGYGSVATGHVDPAAQAVNAIFSTTSTACALGGERPIAGTIGARADTSGRFALFFGTGGIENFDPTLNNDFYAVYADTGEIRGCAEGAPEKGRVQGTCDADTGACEKFYGGVVVSQSDIIVTRATDPPVGTSTCEFGTSTVAGFSVAEFDESFNVTIPGAGATVSSLYGDGGALYFATLSGDIVKIGTPDAPTAGDASGASQADFDPENPGAGTSGGMSVLGWRMLQ